ncbi:hypothetical protein E2C01_024568 [Portunus trituberculatus]|uniref:Uncharacterized protein n=1 Tax=Portunus trituberculatus TaxID=210409 RepID=A0A5B7EE54_PORTR|nr:hypothetical protein [Portunus trituberculatus]
MTGRWARRDCLRHPLAPSPSMPAPYPNPNPSPSRLRPPPHPMPHHESRTSLQGRLGQRFIIVTERWIEQGGPAGSNDRWSPRWSPAGLDEVASCGTLRGHSPPSTNGAFRVSDLLQRINGLPQGTHTLAVMPPL